MQPPRPTKPCSAGAARADAYEAIREGLEDAAHGRTRPARQALSEVRRRHGVPR